MNPISTHNQKRRRGGIGCLVGDEEENAVDNNGETQSSLLRVEVVPLSRAFDLLLNDSCVETRHGRDGNDNGIIEHRRRVRIIYPYPYTFATFAKARWIGRSIVDIYNEEFGEEIFIVRITIAS